MQQLSREKHESQLKLLIAKGKEQGFLTYHEVNDHLPDDIVDPEQIEDIINMINDMGITVHETAPDNDSLILNDTAVTDDDAAEEAAAALATVDNEFGRTTDPVRMYMREMGTVDLLTREGEIRIAKRIEEGLRQVLSALSSYPDMTAELLSEYSRVTAEEIKLADVMIGYNDWDAEQQVPVPAQQQADAADSDDDDEEEAVNTGPDPEEAAAYFVELGKLHKRAINALKKYGTGHARSDKALERLSECFMEVKLSPKLFEKLTNQLRYVISYIRSTERSIMHVCVNQAKMPRKDFINSFPGNEGNAKWLTSLLRSRKPYKEALKLHAEEIRKAQSKLTITKQGRPSFQNKVIKRRVVIHSHKLSNYLC